jgi:hypothetical protein
VEKPAGNIHMEDLKWDGKAKVFHLTQDRGKW